MDPSALTTESLLALTDQSTGVRREVVRVVVEELIGLIGSQIAAGNRVHLRGLGSFKWVKTQDGGSVRFNADRSMCSRCDEFGGRAKARAG